MFTCRSSTTRASLSTESIVSNVIDGHFVFVHASTTRPLPAGDTDGSDRVGPGSPARPLLNSRRLKLGRRVRSLHSGEADRTAASESRVPRQLSRSPPCSLCSPRQRKKQGREISASFCSRWPRLRPVRPSLATFQQRAALPRPAGISLLLGPAAALLRGSARPSPRWLVSSQETSPVRRGEQAAAGEEIEELAGT
jgi:hypothetical protein